MNPSKYTRIYRIYFLLNLLEGAAALFSLFQITSMERSAVLLGFSLPRLAIGFFLLALVLLFLVLALLSFFNAKFTAMLDSRLEKQIAGQDRLLKGSLLLGLGFLIWTGLLVFLSLPAGEFLGMFQAVYYRATGLFIWLSAFAAQTLALLALRFPAQYRLKNLAGDRERQMRLGRFLLGVGAVAGFLTLAGAIFFDIEQLYDFLIGFSLATLLLWMYLRLRLENGSKAARLYLVALLLFVLSFAIYRASTYLVGYVNTPAKAYFDQLADAWLHGRLYLVDPGQTHDLTFYKGEWYVANPPMAAVLMMPWVKMYGVSGLNTVVFSIFFGALNVALVYIILEQLAALGWTKLSHAGNLWFTALFGFGTVHFYLAIVGKMWFISQTITVTFTALAVLLAMTSRPPWLVGMMLGFGIVARPNIALAWFLVFGITAQIQKDAFGRLDWRRLLGWAFLSGLPMAAAVAALLGYNYLRFNNWLDFGYLTENVADFMAADLKQYGTFNTHFIRRNLRVMFLELPEWDPICKRLKPQHQGMSMFLATPALVYLVKSLRRSPWVLGAWGAILALIGLISTYYNTGAWQFGYKYMLDFAIPAVMLLALAAGERPSWLLRLLILASIAINIIGVLWWFGLWCIY